MILEKQVDFLCNFTAFMRFDLKILSIALITSICASLNTEAQPLNGKVLGNGIRAELGFRSALLNFNGDIARSSFSGSNVSIGLEPVIHLSNWMFSLPLERGTVRWNSRTLLNPTNFETKFSTIAVEGKYRFLNDQSALSPFVGFGIGNMFFSSSTDLMDANGILYNYWSDGKIRDQIETPENTFTANILSRDYSYETSTQKNQRIIYYPISIGISGSLVERIRLELSYNLNLLQGDLFDSNIDKSGWDRLSTIRAGIYIDLAKGRSKPSKPVTPKTTGVIQPTVNYDSVNFDALFNEDEDADGVSDIVDKCYGTPKGSPVDEFGCPLDTDEDGIIDFLDEEINSPINSRVNNKGIAWTDQEYLDHRNDSLAYFKSTLRQINKNSRPFPVKKYIPKSNYISWNSILESHPQWQTEFRIRNAAFPQEFKSIDTNHDAFLSNSELEQAVNLIFDKGAEAIDFDTLRKAIEYAFRNQ
jgi:hypothetical protein